MQTSAGRWISVGMQISAGTQTSAGVQRIGLSLQIGGYVIPIRTV